MVVLNKKQLLHHNLYFGKRSVKGSKRKVVNLQGVGLIPLGQGLFTFGEGGSGMTLLGTGFLDKIKQLARPLLKTGKKVVLDAAMSQLGRIKQPELRSLATKGLETLQGDDIEKALRGQDRLGNIADLAKRGIKAAQPELLSLAQKGIKRGMRSIPPPRRGRGVGGRISMDQAGDNANPMMDEVANVTDRALKKDSNSRTQDNRQLTLLKDVIRSKPIKTRTNRAGALGGGLMTL